MANEISAFPPHFSQEFFFSCSKNLIDQSNLQNSKTEYFMFQSDNNLKHLT